MRGQQNTMTFPQFEAIPGASQAIMKETTCNDVDPDKNIGLPEQSAMVRWSNSYKLNMIDDNLNQQGEAFEEAPQLSGASGNDYESHITVDPEVPEFVQRKKISGDPYPHYILEEKHKKAFLELYEKSQSQASKLNFVEIKLVVRFFKLRVDKAGKIHNMRMDKIHPDTIQYVLNMIKHILKNINNTRLWKEHLSETCINDFTNLRSDIHSFVFYKNEGPLNMQWKLSQIYDEICTELVKMSRKNLLVKVIVKQITLPLWSKFPFIEGPYMLLTLASQGRTCAFPTCRTELYPKDMTRANLIGGTNNFVILSNCHHLLCHHCGLTKLPSV